MPATYRKVDGKYVTKTGQVMNKPGRPSQRSHKLVLLLEAMEQGANFGQAAKICGVGRATLHRWRKSDWHVHDDTFVAKARGRYKKRQLRLATRRVRKAEF